MAPIHSRTLSNGLVLLAEPMPHVQSAAFTLLIPAGAVHEPADGGGTATMVAEWISRGAGSYGSRELIEALDDLGVSHSESASTASTAISATTLGSNLVTALSLFADMILRPTLEDEAFDPLRDLAYQSLLSLEDSPDSLAMVELRKRFYPNPWGRCTAGDRASLEAANPDSLRAFWRSRFRPNGAILGIAGAIDWPVVESTIERLLGSWEPGAADEPAPAPTARRNSTDHVLKETNQTQVTLALPSVVLRDPEYYPARASAAILGGYSSSRFFTEVREKRGLCYSVSASYEAHKNLAGLVCYAGTAPERAQETLDVMAAELKRLRDRGVDAEELDMMRAGLKTTLIMQQESSMSRSAALAADWFHLERVRSLAEIAQAMDALTPETVSSHARNLDLSQATVLTLGPAPLAIPDLEN